MDITDVMIDDSDRFFKDMKLEECNSKDDGFCFLLSSFKFKKLKVNPDVKIIADKENLILEYDFTMNTQLKFDWKWHKWTVIHNREGKGEEVKFNTDLTIKIQFVPEFFNAPWAPVNL